MSEYRVVLDNIPMYKWDEKTRTLEFYVTEAQRERMREQMPRGAKEEALLDKAVEALVSRLIGEKVEAEVRLRELQLKGHKCSACGMYTNMEPP